MSLININALTFAYEGSYDNIFENVTFKMDTDWKLGFTGRNGRGKTTFLKLLLGKLDYSGSISASVDFEYFPYEIKNEAIISADIVRKIAPYYEEWELKRELTKLELDIGCLERRFETLSGGEKTKLLLAALFLRRNSFLLIDEPTNHLDLRGRELLGEYLKGKKGFILVSHDRALLDSCTDHTLAINKSGVEIKKGVFSSWLDEKNARDEFEKAENLRLKKEISRLSEAADRASSWSNKAEKSKYNTKNTEIRVDRGFVGHKAAKMMKRAKSIESRKLAAAEEKSGLLKDIEEAEELKLFPLEYHSENIFTLEKLSIFRGEKQVVSELSAVFKRGSRIALCGGNGSGKSTLLSLLCGGEKLSYTGTLSLGSGVVVSYVPQQSNFLDGSFNDFTRERRLDDSLFKAILRKMGFPREVFDNRLSQLSAGQKKKVLIAGSLCQKAHIYIWDEPLNYIDVFSRLQIEELILKYKPSMLFVEHDVEFVNKIATEKIEL